MKKVTAVAMVLVLSSLFFIALFRRDAAAPSVEFLGLTNRLSSRHYQTYALFRVSNSANMPLLIDLHPELKRPYWPVYGRTNLYLPLYAVALDPHQSTNIIVDPPPASFRGVWRFRVSYVKPASDLDVRRLRWSQSLRGSNDTWVARAVRPKRERRETVTSEMQN